MGQRRHLHTALAAILATAPLTTGCAPTRAVRVAVSEAPVPTISRSAAPPPAAPPPGVQPPGVQPPAVQPPAVQPPAVQPPAAQPQAGRTAAGASAASGRHGGRERSVSTAANGSTVGAVELPADWPADLPVPAGNLRGSTGSAGRWSVLILAAGSATEVLRSAVAFYSSAGFTPVSDSALNRGNRQITLVTENRDHSATQTNLVIGVTTH
jgi:hypothetical protein